MIDLCSHMSPKQHLHAVVWSGTENLAVALQHVIVYTKHHAAFWHAQTDRAALKLCYDMMFPELEARFTAQ